METGIHHYDAFPSIRGDKAAGMESANGVFKKET